MVELGEHCHTHIIPRLKKVIDGADPGGITKALGWKGGGGFRYYRLAPSLLERDKWGNWVISKEFNAAMLAGMLPMAFGLGEGGSLAAPLGRAVIGGLLVSTFTTVTILPSIYAILQRKASLKSPSLNPMDPASRYYDAKQA